jgi:hypothetical protein
LDEERNSLAAMNETQLITVRQAYDAMLIFLQRYYERTDSSELGGLLGGFAVNEGDGRTMDPAAERDWHDAVEAVLAR